MRIAFDLDETLISARFPQEKCSWWRKLFLRERLRRGTVRLFQKLQNHGHRIWIYTTSCRTPGYIERLFRFHGLRLDGIINQDIHAQAKAPTSKYPPAFDIDVLIDDSEGVALEGRKHGFKVIVVSPDNRDWCNAVLSSMKIIEKEQQAQRLAGTMPVGYVLWGLENNSLMYHNAPELPICSRCGYKTDFDYVNPTLKIRRRIYDLSFTHDGCAIASQRFKEHCIRCGYTGLHFIPLPSDPEFFYVKIESRLQCDMQAQKTRCENFCPECENFESVVGVTPAYLKNVTKPLPDGFYRSEQSFASGNEKSPLIIVGLDTYQKLKREKLTGIIADEVRVKISFIPAPQAEEAKQ